MLRALLSLVAVLTLTLVVGCGGDDDDNLLDQVTDEEDVEETATAAETASEEEAESPTEEATVEPTAEAGAFSAADCPIDDAEFCEVAVDVANALVAGDEDAIGQVSAEQEIDCEEVAVEAFPECAPGETLTGFVTSAAQGENIVRALGDYTSFVGTLLDSVDPAASDPEGSGEMQILVVGPRGDGYDMLATAILNVEDPDFGEGAGEQRWYFFLTFDQADGGDWLVHAFVADTADGFANAGFADPAADLLPSSEPWGSGG